MGNKAVLGLLVLAALGAVFFLFGGAEWIQGSPAGGGGGAGTAAGPDPLAGASGEDERAEPEGTRPGGPVLFGRARAERVGVGGLVGQVVDFDSGAPVPEAAVVIAGEGYGGEATAVQERTDAEGRFRFAELAAGDTYVLQVTDARQRQRMVPAVVIDADRETDLGVLYMGKAAGLEGLVLDARGLPLADARVQVHAGGGSMMDLLQNMTKLLEVLDRDAEPLARATSERSGNFEIASLAPGPYTLVVRAAGHQVATQKVVMTSSGAAGGRVSVRLQAAAPIVGIVVDENGRGIAGARIACMDKDQMQSVMFGRQFSITDADGRFRIESPPTQGGFAVIVGAEGYPSLFTEAQSGQTELRFVLVGGTEVLVRVLEKDTELPIEGAKLMAMFSKDLQMAGNRMSFASGVTDDRGEATFLARPGKMQMLFLSHPERGSGMYNPMMAMMAAGGILEGPKDTTVGANRATFVFHLRAGVTVRGTVTDEEGKGIAGARVTTMGMMGMGGSAIADAQGAYEMRNQSPPVTLVLASAPGYVQKQGGMPSFGGPPAADGVLVRDVAMTRAGSISGRVVDESGRPLAGVQVRAGGGDRGGMAVVAALLGGARESITNAAGRYVLDGVAPGQDVHVMGHFPSLLDSRTSSFAVTTGAVKAPDLVMRAGARLLVRVEDPDGSPARGARIEVNVDSASDVAWDPLAGWNGFADLVTSAAGRAEVRDVPDGDITLTASKDGYAPVRRVVKVERSGDDAPEVVLRLGVGATVGGRVVDAEGAPIAGALVHTEAAERRVNGVEAGFVPQLTATTDRQGRFELKGLPDEALTLRARAAGYQSLRRAVQPGDMALELRLVKTDPDVAKRLEALNAELMEVSQAMQAAKDDAERSALTARLLKLVEEQQALQEQVGEDLPPAIPQPLVPDEPSDDGR